jgi:hypothetical protein
VAPQIIGLLILGHPYSFRDGQCLFFAGRKYYISEHHENSHTEAKNFYVENKTKLGRSR